MTWLFWTLALALALAALALICSAAGLGLLIWHYIAFVYRIFEEKPLFIIPRGQPLEGSEEVRFRTADGLTLAGSYLPTPAPERKGVVLFGPEFGSNRWSCGPYTQHLLAAGYDIFTFDFRNHGDSDRQPGYEPLQWVTEYEVLDTQAAIAYLKTRGDRDPRGIGLFGISRGGGAGILAAANDPWVRCVVTDGAFATRTTMVPYMQKWIEIYVRLKFVVHFLPRSVYVFVAMLALRNVARRRRCRFPSMERAIRKLSPRPLLMIHGERDTYIKPAIARELFDLAREPKEFWLVSGAKHNQALHIARDEYPARVHDFFKEHLAAAGRVPEAAAIS